MTLEHTSVGSEQRMQASAATAAAVNEAVAMESSDSDSSTEDDDAQPNNGRARLRTTSLSHVLLVASICGAPHFTNSPTSALMPLLQNWEASKGSQGENDLGLFSSPQSSGCTFRPAALKARAAHFGLRQHAFMRIFKKVIGCIDGILIKV